jgi:hypothetical protein
LRALVVGLCKPQSGLVVGGDRLKRVVLPLPVKVVGIESSYRLARSRIGGEHARRKLQSVDGDETIAVRKRQRPQQDPIDQRENGRRCPDAKRQVTTAAIAKPGLRRNWRRAKVTSCETVDNMTGL